MIAMAVSVAGWCCGCGSDDDGVAAAKSWLGSGNSKRTNNYITLGGQSCEGILRSSAQIGGDANSLLVVVVVSRLIVAAAGVASVLLELSCR